MTGLRTLAPKSILDGDGATAGISSSSALRWWRRSQALQTSNILLCGDSITEGTRGSDAPFLRWADHLAAGIRRLANPASVRGGIWISADGYYLTKIPANWGYTGAVVKPAATGLGYWNVEMPDAATATLTIDATGFRIHYDRRTDGGTLNVTIDGVSAGSINTAGAANSGMSQDFTGLAPGRHTIVLTASGVGTTSSLQGAYCYNGDETTGHRVYVAGHGGIYSNAVTQAGFAAWISQTTPDLVTLFYGVNDYRNNVAPATFRSNLQTGIGTIRAARPNASIAIIAAYEPIHPGTPIAGWANYVSAMKGAARANDCLFVDLADTFGPGIPTAADGLVNADQVHPDDPGHRAIADQLLAAIIGPGKPPSLQEKVWLPANAFVGAIGAPTLTPVNNTFVSWDLDQSTAEGVLGSASVPPEWKTFTADLWVMNRSASSGDVRMRMILSQIQLGQAALSLADTTVTHTVDAAANIPTRSLAHVSGIRANPDAVLRIQVNRTATDGADTLANDCGFLGVMLRRTA